VVRDRPKSNQKPLALALELGKPFAAYLPTYLPRYLRRSAGDSNLFSIEKKPVGIPNGASLKRLESYLYLPIHLERHARRT